MLFDASWFGNKAAVELFLAAGAEIDAKDQVISIATTLVCTFSNKV